MKKLGPFVRVTSVEPLEGFVVRLTFQDDTRKEVDLEQYLQVPSSSRSAMTWGHFAQSSDW
jgi:hypothetical protein